MPRKKVEEITVEAEVKSENVPALIVVEQLPIIKEQLFSVKEQFQRETAEAVSMECTEETVKLVKERRAQISKVFNSLEAMRKEAKKAILAPYEAFEAVYKDCVTSIYKPCDERLAEKIAEVEDGLKREKRKMAQEYFNECCAAANIDFLSIDRVGLNIGLTTSKKSIQTAISAFVTKVSEELTLIDAQEDSAEVLIEYKQSLNVAAAIMAVKNRHKAMAEEQARLDIRRAKVDEQYLAASRVESAVEEFAAPTAAIIPEEAPAPEQTAETVYELSFVVRGTLEQLKTLKAFLYDNGYDVRNGDDENG